MKDLGVPFAPRSVCRFPFKYMLRRTVSLFRAARSSVAQAEIFWRSTMSRKRQVPPGHGFGKFVCSLYVIRLRVFPWSCCGVSVTGEASAALADSVNIPAMLWNGVIQWKPMWPHPE